MSALRWLVAASFLSSFSGAVAGCRADAPAAMAGLALAAEPLASSLASPCAALPPLAPAAIADAGREFFVAPDARDRADRGDGSRDRPWDLATALAASDSVRAGDTVWLAPGIYRGSFASRLTGSRERPVVVRGRPGGRVALDGDGAHDPVLTVEGGFAVYRDFEVFNSRPSSDADSSNVVPRGPGTRLVNLVIHDASSTGI